MQEKKERIRGERRRSLRKDVICSRLARRGVPVVWGGAPLSDAGFGSIAETNFKIRTLAREAAT